MSGFLYFLPGIRPHEIAADVLSRFSLDCALGGEDTIKSWTEKGPGGKPGTIVMIGQDPAKTDYRPEKQEWREQTGFWIGHWIDEKIQRSDLARAEQLGGHPVILEDGQAWSCPIARSWIELDGELRWYSPLPRRLVLKEGKWESGEVVAKYARLWGLAERFERSFYEAPQRAGEGAEGKDVQIELDFQDAVAAAVEVLGVNYRVGPAEVEILGILTDQNVYKILQALIDWPTHAEWLKKKLSTAPDIGNIAAGSGG